ncbi:MAG: imidazole glycerol phosphate synthase subunit HisH, partial [Firmicutes bacterium]|nr:imidazole glycerol phosphate synthase subunit HisH [Bacillota bacterium]
CGVSCEAASSPDVLKHSSGIIFPGVGAAGRTMEMLAATGLDRALTEEIRAGKPYLGICLGMQILFDYSEEDKTPCLCILPGVVRRFPRRFRVPHMGWNDLCLVREHPLLAGIKSGTDFYFAHSYYCEPGSKDLIIGEIEYGIRFAGIVAEKNVMGVQFHPEKSSRNGLQLIRNFCLLAEALAKDACATQAGKEENRC